MLLKIEYFFADAAVGPDGLQTKKWEDGLDELLVVCGEGAYSPQRGDVGVLNERAEFVRGVVRRRECFELGGCGHDADARD